MGIPRLLCTREVTMITSGRTLLMAVVLGWAASQTPISAHYEYDTNREKRMQSINRAADAILEELPFRNTA
jgi:aspartate ammonia-lyase